MTQKETLKHEADAVAGRGVVLPFNHGRELGSQRLKTRIMKLNSPGTYKPIEIALRMIVEHSSQRLKTWDLQNYQSGTATESWASSACFAGYAISTDQEAEENWLVLRKAAEDFSTILQRQEPMLVWSTCSIIIQLFAVNTELAMGFIRVVLDFCIKQLREGDPLRALWEAVLRTDPSHIPQLIARLVAAQLGVLHQTTASTNPFVVQYTKSSAKYLHDRHLLMSYDAHNQIEFIIQALNSKLKIDSTRSIRNSLISASLFQACIHLDDKEYEKVEMILDTIQPKVNNPGFGIEHAQVVNFYEVKAEMLMERGNYERGDNRWSEHYYKKALEIAQTNLSETMPERIGFCLMALGTFYRRIGDANRLEEIQVRYDKHLKWMAGEHLQGMAGEKHPKWIPTNKEDIEEDIEEDSEEDFDVEEDVEEDFDVGEDVEEAVEEDIEEDVEEAVEKAIRMPLAEWNIRWVASNAMHQVPDSSTYPMDQVSEACSNPIDQVSDVFSNPMDTLSEVFSDVTDQASDYSPSPIEQVSDVLSYLGPGQHIIEVHVQWELPDFVSQGLDNMQELATVMTITGQPYESYINSCENYIKSTWGKNPLIIEFFQAFVKSNLDFSAVSHEQFIFSSNKLNVSAMISSPAFPGDSNGFTFRLRATSHHLVETCQCILWLAAACRPPESGSVYASVANFRKIGVQRFKIDTEPLKPLTSLGSQSEFPCCWLNMFDGGYVLAQGFPTPPREYGRGLELPLDIMIEQAMAYSAINHTINGQDCMILKGRHTALVPIRIEGLETLDQTSEVQWHLVGKRPDLVPIDSADQIKSEQKYHLTDVEFSNTSRDLSWEEIDAMDESGLRIFPIGSIREVSSKRSFVGHFPKAQIFVGSDRERYDELKGEPKAEPVGGHVIKFGQAVSLTLGTNAATGGLLTMSAGTTIKRSKFDSVPKRSKAFIADKLRNDRNKPHILYDTSKKIGWMIPEPCLILYLIHYWAALQSEVPTSSRQTGQQKHHHHGKDDGETQPMSSVKEHMPFIKASSNAAQDAADAILHQFMEPSELPRHIRFLEDPEKLVYVRDIICNMYLAIDTLVEHQQQKKPGTLNRLNPLATHHDLWGYDLADVAGFDEAPVKRVSIDKTQCGGWHELAKPNTRIVVLFGNNFGELIKYEDGQMICNQWKSVPPKRDFLSADSGTLEYLQELVNRGRCGIFLTDKNFLISNLEQKDCLEEDWPCCNMTLQMTLTAPKRTIRVGKGEAVIIGKVLRREKRKSFGEMFGQWRATPDETALQEPRKLPKQNHSQCAFSPPGACPLCSEANRLEIGSSSEKSSPEGADLDLGTTPGTSSSYTPQSS
ncbi:hypothetical protein PFICI_04148 [Pestalotiopsis fici W106-1]|uniref:Uncharacterized protein n=1 Tax=Pestalotiopsis fici (strain W106-1 / CGMCC3.15140) TaxID=1229662 RepID=W3XJ83_PESFW|nr:uncharacterized protein PFICI_04148 [Pestalotiopsis fici W106-1]ETS86123.1 hypothetical protein PFICI_04148 [Pestalotiopsis fici W106-1]